MRSEFEHPVPARLKLGQLGVRIYLVALALGVAGLASAVALGYLAGDGWRRFYFSYLVAFVFVLSIALGGLFFVLLQHVTRAGWSVSSRRVAEAVTATLPLLAVLAIPLIVSVMSQNGSLYPWANRVQLDEKILAKRAFLNPIFFTIRLVVYFMVWAGLGVWYWRWSTKQDESGDVEATQKMQGLSAPAMVAYAATVTVASFDLLMSLDAHWYSTIFGVYFFSGCAVAIYAFLILTIYLLQKAGKLTQSVTIEHYHDLGKFLFGFTFFWGYIAFSQYMLIWYANIPEETAWLRRHGMSTAPWDITHWSYTVLALLFGHFVIPFAGLMSRHVKRRPGVLAFWAAWMLVFHFVDLYWVVMPQFGPMRPKLIDLAALVGIGGLFITVFAKLLSGHVLRPAADPRLEESLVFENV